MAVIPLFTNRVPISIDTDGSVYNGGLGYIDGYRLNSSGGLTASALVTATGFIPAKGTDIIRLKGLSWHVTGDFSYIAYYDSSFTLLGSLSISYDGSYTARGIVSSSSSRGYDSDGSEIFNMVFSDSSKIAYIRVNGYGSGAKLIVTVNERIIYGLETLDLSTHKTLLLNGVRIKKLAINGVQVWGINYTNLVPTAIDTDGSIYNGTGYKDGYRLSTEGALKEQSTTPTTTSGFIKSTNGDVVIVAGAKMRNANGFCYICFYDENFKILGSSATYGASGPYWNKQMTGASTPVFNIDESGDIVKTTITIKSPQTTYKYIRITAHGSGADMVITVNEEI